MCLSSSTMCLFLFCFNLQGEIPRNTDEDTWISSTSTTAASLHLFFNVSAVQAQTRQGYQLYVIGAKLRLHKYAEVINSFNYYIL